MVQVHQICFAEPRHAKPEAKVKRKEENGGDLAYAEIATLTEAFHGLA